MGNAPSAASAWGHPSGEAPSIFGALPGGSAGRGRGSPPAPDATLFHITAFRPDILNATVVDARGRSCYRIATEPSQPHSTTYYDARRRTVAVVDWSGAQPSVVIPGLAPRQSICSWLTAAPDRASRMMEVRGVPYVWVPEGENISVRSACPLLPLVLGKNHDACLKCSFTAHSRSRTVSHAFMSAVMASRSN